MCTPYVPIPEEKQIPFPSLEISRKSSKLTQILLFRTPATTLRLENGQWPHPACHSLLSKDRDSEKLLVCVTALPSRQATNNEVWDYQPQIDKYNLYCLNQRCPMRDITSPLSGPQKSCLATVLLEHGCKSQHV